MKLNVNSVARVIRWKTSIELQMVINPLLDEYFSGEHDGGGGDHEYG